MAHCKIVPFRCVVIPYATGYPIIISLNGCAKMDTISSVTKALRQVIESPCLATARNLESELSDAGFGKQLLGRVNQKSSIDAAGQSDRGIAERIANAFDACAEAARITAGVESSPDLRPRVAVRQFLNPNTEMCVWDPQDARIQFSKPVVQFWADNENEKLLHRRYHPPQGLMTILVRDFSRGISRERMPTTILDLNCNDKLETFEAIGQFGHGGSSTLAFSELCLVMTMPRFEDAADKVFWTLIFPEPAQKASKQSLIRKWFCCDDNLPLVVRRSEIPELSDAFPGTSVWHFGYVRDNWLKGAAGSHQDTPAGRLGRLFFSYPLPFEIHGELARGDSATAMRTVKGAYFRLVEERTAAREVVECRSAEKSETLIVEGLEYGNFSVFYFVLNDQTEVRSFVDHKHPIIITLNGQNHGEMTANLLVEANLPETSGSMIVEIRLDGLMEEALNNIISNSRELPKTSVFTAALKERVRSLLHEDEALREIEQRRQEAKAKQSSEELNRKIRRFLTSILSDAISEPSEGAGGDAPGELPSKSSPSPRPRPEIPSCDSPQVLEFLSNTPVFVPEGTARIVKFKSDARPPKYSFHGDNPRCFARLDSSGPRGSQVSITGRADIDPRGYGSITLSCTETPKSPVEEHESVGILEIVIQTTDGRSLNAKLDVGVASKPQTLGRKRRQSVEPVIVLCVPDGADRDHLASLLAEDEDKIVGFGTHLNRYRETLEVEGIQCAYWGEASSKDGKSVLTVEINVAHPKLVSSLRGCANAEERVRIKERVVQDIVLDCYQHSFRLDDVPEKVHEQVVSDPDDVARAAEICLNYDKILRMVTRNKKIPAVE